MGKLFLNNQIAATATEHNSWKSCCESNATLSEYTMIAAIAWHGQNVVTVRLLRQQSKHSAIIQSAAKANHGVSKAAEIAD